MQFLMGLNDSYSQIKGKILLMDPLPSINFQEERQRSVGHGNSVHIESTTLAVKGSNPNFNSNFPGFSSNYVVSRGKNSKGKDKPICTHCGSLVMSWRNASSYMVFHQASSLKEELYDESSQCLRGLCR